MAINRLLGTGPGRARRRHRKAPMTLRHAPRGSAVPSLRYRRATGTVHGVHPSSGVPAPRAGSKEIVRHGKGVRCGSAESPPIWCRPQHRGAPRQDHPGADAPSEAEDQPIIAVQASKGLTHRNIESDSLPFIPRFARRRSAQSARSDQAGQGAAPVVAWPWRTAHGAKRASEGCAQSAGEQRTERVRTREHIRRNVSGGAEQPRGRQRRAWARRAARGELAGGAAARAWRRRTPATRA